MSNAEKSSRRKKAVPSAHRPVPEGLTYQAWQECYSKPQKRQAIIRQICRLIVQDFQPEKIILFGSQAYGKPTPDSDIDLLVVLPVVKDALEQSVLMLKKLTLPISIDLMARTSGQIQQRLKMGDSFIKEIIEAYEVLEDPAKRALYDSLQSGSVANGGVSPVKPHRDPR